LFYSKTT